MEFKNILKNNIIGDLVIMEGDDEPHLRTLRILCIGLILLIISLSTVDAVIIPKKSVSVGKCYKPIVHEKVVKKNTIGGYFKPSVKSGYLYKWYYRTWINKCSYCGHHLLLNPKGVPERELTCSHCSADYDGVTGYVKNGRFNKRLTRA